MADDPNLLAQGILDRLDQEMTGPVLLTGSLPVLVELSKEFTGRPGVRPFVVSPDKPKKLLKLKGIDLLRSVPTWLPVGEDTLTALVAVQALGRTVQEARSAIEDWRKALAPNGRLVLAEALSWSPAIRVLTRARLAPEDLTGLLLNAEFGDIRQTWTRPRRGTVITTGRLRRF